MKFMMKRYKAKRMELGLVVGAAPAENIIREKPKNGDIIILLGGRTGSGRNWRSDWIV